MSGEVSEFLSGRKHNRTWELVSGKDAPRESRGGGEDVPVAVAVAVAESRCGAASD